MGRDARSVLQFSIARQLFEATRHRPGFYGLEQLSPDALSAKFGLDIPGLQIGHWNRRSPVHMLVSNGDLGKAAQSAVIALSNDNDAGMLASGKLLNLEPLPRRAAIRPQGATQANPFRKILHG